MKIFFLTLSLLFSGSFCIAQVPEWMVIDVQKIIMYDWIKDIFDFELEDQEILELSLGENGSIWLNTQDYKIKYLPSNLVVYSIKDLNNPLYFFTNDNFSFTYYSRIYKEEIANKYPHNTWVKYEHPDSYDFALWTEDIKKRESYLESFNITNYSVPLTDKKEINLSEVLSSVLINYPELWLSLSCEKPGKFIVDTDKKISYRLNFKKSKNTETIFDVLKDTYGNIWIATGKRLIRFDGEKFYEIDIPAFILEMDLQNNVWIGTTAYNSVGSLVRFDGKSFTFYNSLNSPLPENDGILDLKTDRRGNLWIALKRIGLPDHLQNIKIALYNSSGVNLVSDVFLQNISWCREPISKNISTLFYDRIQFQINLERIKPFSKIEFLINDKVIHYVERESILKNNGEINFTYYLSKPDKYPIKVYLYDTIGIKTEMANVELNLQFNRLGFFLGQNEPNPFKDYTVIEYGFFQGRIVELKIFDQYLRQVGSVSERIVTWIGKPYVFQTKNAANGCYYYYLKENYTGIISSKKMILFNPERIISLPH